MNYIIYTYIKGRNYRPTSRRNFGCLDFNVFKGLIRCFILGITVCVYIELIQVCGSGENGVYTSKGDVDVHTSDIWH